VIGRREGARFDRPPDSEIAEQLFISEANVYKLLGRARRRLRTLPSRRVRSKQRDSRPPAT